MLSTTTARSSGRRRSAFAATAALLAVAAVGCSGGGGGGDDERAQPPAAPPAAPSDGADRTTSSTTSPSSTSSPAAGATAPTTPVVIPVAGAPAGAGVRCAEQSSWSTEPQSAQPMSIEDLYLVRAGRHDCYDRVVFDVNGVVAGPDAVGFDVSYVSGEATADPSGEPVPTAADAALQVGVRAPAHGYGTTGHSTMTSLGRVGDALVTTQQVRGWSSLREVRFAGSFEGQSAFAVGVARKLPFRAGAYEADGYTHVYVDIAHAP